LSENGLKSTQVPILFSLERGYPRLSENLLSHERKSSLLCENKLESRSKFTLSSLERESSHLSEICRNKFYKNSQLLHNTIQKVIHSTQFQFKYYTFLSSLLSNCYEALLRNSILSKQNVDQIWQLIVFVYFLIIWSKKNLIIFNSSKFSLDDT